MSAPPAQCMTRVRIYVLGAWRTAECESAGRVIHYLPGMTRVTVRCLDHAREIEL